MEFKVALETLKKIISIADEAKQIEMKEYLLKLKEEMLELKDENLELKDQLSRKQNYNMIFKNNMYYNIKEKDEKEGPFCSCCWDTKNIAVRVQKENRSGYCPACRKYVIEDNNRSIEFC